MKQGNLSPVAWLVILLAVACLPRVTIDIYLPSLPAIGQSLAISDFELNLTLTLYMVGYAVSMLVCGPLADRYGRRPVLVGGTAIYLAATVVCALATSGTTLIVARLVQALGGCCGTVVARVIVRDRFEQAEQVVLLSWISSGMALSPVVAPVIGSLIDVAFGWRWVFVTLALVAGCVLLALCTVVPETRPEAPETRSEAFGARPVDARDTAAGVPGGTRAPGFLSMYTELLRDRLFLRYAFIITGIYCTYFPFVVESSMVLQRTMGLSQTQYAMVFALTILGYLGGAAVFRNRYSTWGADGVIRRAMVLNIVFVLVWAMATALFPGSLLAIVLPMMPIMLSVGMVTPACQFAVLQSSAGTVGTASGLYFFIQMSLTALCSLVVAHLSDGTSGPMVKVSVAASALAWAVVKLLPLTPAGQQKPAR